ncbi:efflux RND transporter permease subunit [Paraglaciecola arctica]|uniref:efflux RND transporter permease subunit n=1 Tax=Paraglaciecola arctica TaxID=1128911 RepID=UPI001C06D1E2|nr:efflux RND transporter permease subunit [Paraglaciecola arctica]MBU3004653.1 efflux RND transporter permease subunit [Paraglaciecola arctica]
MIDKAVSQGRLLSVVVLIICILGIVAAQRMPVQMIPNLETRIISIETGWPGATPQDIEKEILLEQERYLRSLPNLSRMESFAKMGEAVIELEFPFGVDANEALIRVSNALSQVPNYPENVDQPRLFSESFSENAFMYFAVFPKLGNPHQLDMDMISDFIDDNVRPRMERVAGVSQVNMNGTLRQIQIHVDPARLAQRNISINDVNTAIRARNRDISAGDINDGKRRYLLRTKGRFAEVDDLKTLILAHRNGSNIRLGDVAEIRLDHYEKRGVAYVNGEPAFTMSVKREQGSNVIDIKRAMLAEIEKIKVDLLEPNGMRIYMIGDDVRYVESSVSNVFTNLCLGALLATIVMYLFLRSGRATLICLMGIPVCTIASFIGLATFDRTINVISLAGIAFAIGMTVDNSIVVLESIEQAKRRGLERYKAAVAGVRDVWSAVLASSSTTVLVFSPVLFIDEEAGQLYSDIALAISASIIASMLFALFIVPAASAAIGGRVVKREKTNNKAGILGLTRWICHTAKRRYVTMLVSLFVSLGLAIILMPAAEYLPEGEEPKAFSKMVAPPGYNIEEMQRIGDEVRLELDRAKALSDDEYDPSEHLLPPLKYYLLRVSAGQVWVMSEPTNNQNIDLMMAAIVNLFEQYPGMRAFSSRGSIISSNQGGTRAVELSITGPDLADLYNTARHVMSRAKTVFVEPRIDSSPATLSLDQPLIEIHPKWERLAELGFDPADFGFTVAAYSDGAFVGEFIDGDDKVDMFLFSTAGNNQQLNSLAQVPIRAPSGQVLPLSALAELRETVDSEELRRVNGQRTVSVYIIPADDIALETAVDKVRMELIPALKANGELPTRVAINITGAADDLAATRSALLSNFMVALILIYLLLVMIFSHWGYPLLILTTVPLGIAGGLVGLVASNNVGALLAVIGFDTGHQALDMITMLGFVILLGTVVNNPILIVEQTRRNLHVHNLPILHAVQEAVATRLRPILMSTATTILGLAPLVFIPGAGTELYRGIGIVVLFGLLASMLLTLSFLPCLLIEVFNPKAIWRRKLAN